LSRGGNYEVNEQDYKKLLLPQQYHVPKAHITGYTRYHSQANRVVKQKHWVGKRCTAAFSCRSSQWSPRIWRANPRLPCSLGFRLASSSTGRAQFRLFESLQSSDSQIRFLHIGMRLLVFHTSQACL
jgi:hypothetical protein